MSMFGWLTSDKRIPYSTLNWMFMPVAAFVGGTMFVMTGSWLEAVRWYVCFFGICWVLVVPTTWITGAVSALKNIIFHPSRIVQ